MESNSIEEILGGISSPAASELTAPADADRIGVYDASANAGSRYKWMTLSTLITYIKTSLASWFVKPDWSTLTTYPPLPDSVADTVNIRDGADLDLSAARVINLDVIGDVKSFDFINAKPGAYLFRFKIGGDGSYTISLASSKWSTTSPAPTLTTAVGRIDTWFCFYNGTTMDVIAVNKEVQTS